MALANDRFAGQGGNLSDPAVDAIAITPANSDLVSAVRAIYVGGAGDVTVKTTAGTTVAFVAVPAGTIVPVRCTQVRSTGTTATSIVGLV